MLDMYDHCKELAQSAETATIYYGNGLGNDLWYTAEQLKCSSRNSASAAVSWAQTKVQNGDKFQNLIDNLNDSIDFFEENGVIE